MKLINMFRIYHFRETKWGSNIYTVRGQIELR
jgi:hypothetical protein